MRPAEFTIDPTDTLPAGAQVGPCVVDRLAARGPFAAVYEARHAASGERLALKEFLPAGLIARRGLNVEARGPGAIALFDRGRSAFLAEAHALAGLSHPALLPVHQVWEANGTAYRTMPWADGQPLDRLRATLGASPDRATLCILVDALLGALETVHAAGLVHGAVSPQKILAGSGEVPLLMDFSAVRRALVGAAGLASAGTMVSFEAPEQRARGALGPWTDLYSMAAVVRFAAGGRAPRQGAGAGEPDPLVRLEPGLRNALRSAVDEDPAARPASVAAFRALAEGAAAPSPAASATAVKVPADSGFVTTPAGDEPAESVLEDVERTLNGVARRALHDATAHLPRSGRIEAPSARRRRRTASPPRRDGSKRWTARRAIGVGLLATVVGAAALLVWSAQTQRFQRLGTMIGVLAAGHAQQAAPAKAAPPPAPAFPAQTPSQAPAPSEATTSQVLAAPAPVDAVRMPAAVRPAEPMLPSAPRPLAAPAPPPKLAQAAPPRTAQAQSAGSPRAVCGDRTQFALYRCLQSLCTLTKWYAHPQCVKLRETDQVD